MGQPFMVVFTINHRLGHPALGDHPPMLHLEGLLAWAIAQERFGPQAYRRFGRDSFEHLPVPLDTVLPGVSAGSQGFAPIARHGTTLLTRRYDRASIDPETRPIPETHPPTYKKVEILAQFLPDIIPVGTLYAPYLVFFGRGDPDAVRILLQRHIHFLGHKRGSGYGQVLRCDVFSTTTDWSWSRYDTDGIHLHRPLPVDPEAVATAIGVQWGTTARSVWRVQATKWPQQPMALVPPYYDPNRQVPCYVPDHFGLVEPAEFLHTAWPEYAPWRLNADDTFDENTEPDEGPDFLDAAISFSEGAPL